MLCAEYKKYISACMKSSVGPSGVISGWWRNSGSKRMMLKFLFVSSKFPICFINCFGHCFGGGKIRFLFWHHAGIFCHWVFLFRRGVKFQANLQSHTGELVLYNNLFASYSMRSWIYWLRSSSVCLRKALLLPLQ